MPPAAEAPEYQVLEAIKASIEAISDTAEFFRTDYKEVTYVEEGRISYDQLPVVILAPIGLTENQEKSRNIMHERMRLGVMVRYAVTYDRVKEGYQILHDMKKTLLEDDSYSGLITDIQYIGSELDISQIGDQIGEVLGHFMVQFRYDKLNLTTLLGT